MTNICDPVGRQRGDFFRRAISIGRCESGLAMIEFALALPVLLTLCLFGLETANYAMAHLRVSNIAVLAADNAARVRDSIDEADVIEVLIGAKMTGDGIDFAQNGRIILSDLEETPTGSKQWIRWQRCDGAMNVTSSYGRPLTASGTPIVNATEIYATDRIATSASPSSPAMATMTAMGPPANQITAQAGTAVMMVEVVYQYQPIIPNSFLSGRIIRYESAFNVRQRVNQQLNNSGRITPRACNSFQA
jgi:hypothetical protein